MCYKYWSLVSTKLVQKFAYCACLNLNFTFCYLINVFLIFNIFKMVIILFSDFFQIHVNRVLIFSPVIYLKFCGILCSLVAQWLRICLPIQETWVRPLIWEDPLEKEMKTYSSIIAWTEEPRGQ